MWLATYLWVCIEYWWGCCTRELWLLSVQHRCLLRLIEVSLAQGFHAAFTYRHVLLTVSAQAGGQRRKQETVAKPANEPYQCVSVQVKAMSGLGAVASAVASLAGVLYIR